MRRALFVHLWVALLVIFSTSCGAVQSIEEATSSAFGAVFTASVDTLKIDLVARESLNSDDNQQPLSVLVRIYQLSDIKSFMSNDYQALFDSDREMLGSNILALKEVIMVPGGAVSISEGMHEDTRYVAVAAFYRYEVDQRWRLYIKRTDLSSTTPWKIELSNYQLDVLEK